ncbi:MAG: hypothetical protein KKH11_01420 [Candidatus Omnitrophica bacterium]|nr:hypothetical protein [Candidatus Omnitrophota bacterium]
MFSRLFRKKVKVVKVKRKSKAGKVQTKTRRPKKAKMPQIAGKVTHYFPHVKAGVILVTKGKIVPGDTLHIKGYTTDFKQKVGSMEINNVPVKTAVSGQEIGLLVKSRVRHHDVVYKL